MPTASLNLTPAPRMGRATRSPQHTFQVSAHPWCISPFLIAPVLPGETLKNLLLQARIVSNPVANPLIGWWTEYYIFYVKLRDLDGRADFEEMMIDMTKDMSSLYSATDQKTYHRGSALNYTQMCLERVTEVYFRNEGEAWNNFVDTDSGLPMAKVSQKESWFDSVILSSDMPADLIDQTPTADIPFATLDPAYRTWEFMRQMGIMQADFDDYLRMSGIRPNVEEQHEPELIRMLKEWSYPTNTVEPTSGVPSSALSWTIQERADKNRFFREPGFIFGVWLTRPKVYYHEQRGAAVSMLDNAFSWLPAIMREDKATSLKLIDNAIGPVEGATSDYWVDIRDLFLYGDQFHNRSDTAPGTPSANYVELPTTAWQREYLAGNDTLYQRVFTDQTAGASGLRYVHSDGVVRLNIASHEARDATPGRGTII